jgi:hypothetical protein
VRALLADGERWLATEHAEELDEARAALDRCRLGLDTGPREEVIVRAAL